MRAAAATVVRDLAVHLRHLELVCGRDVGRFGAKELCDVVNSLVGNFGGGLGEQDDVFF